MVEIISTRFQMRRRSPEDWTLLNEVLLEGEFGIESSVDNPDKFKIGDGVTPWNSLAYAGGSAAGIESVVAGANITIDNTDPANPIISATGSAGSPAYHHSQGIPSDAWAIPHNLGYNPAGIVVRDSGDTLVAHGDPEYVDTNNLILHWPYAFGGTADLS